MEPIITINEYPIGWEWLDRVPLEDFTWLIEIFATMTDNTDTYDFATFDKEATNGEPPYPVIEISTLGLANFLNEVPGHTKDYTEGFTEEMVIPYRTEELNPYPRCPQPRNKQKSSSLRIHKAKRDITNK